MKLITSIRGSFIKKIDEWCIGWQIVTMSGTTSSYNGWPRLALIMTASGAMSDNEWQRLTTCYATSDSKWRLQVKRVKSNRNELEQLKGSDFRFKNEAKANLVPEAFYSAIYQQYRLFRNRKIDDIQYFLYLVFLSYKFFSCFSLPVLLKLLKRRCTLFEKNSGIPKQKK